MAAIFQNSVFIHIPKTGGTTVRRACANLITRETGETGQPDAASDAKHASFEIIRDRIGGRPCFTTVRSTLDWYRSNWCHKIRRGTKAEAGILSDAVWRFDFPEWIQSATYHCPGSYGELLNGMIGDSAAALIRTEHLWEDLSKTLQCLGEDLCRVIPVIPQNMAGAEQNDAHWTSDLVERVLSTEGFGKYPDAFMDRHGDRLGKGLVQHA